MVYPVQTWQRDGESMESVLFFFLHWDTTGFQFLFEECVTVWPLLRVYHWERVLGIWGLASSWRLLFLICILCSKHVCMEREGGREREEDKPEEDGSYWNIRRNSIVYSVGHLSVCEFCKCCVMTLSLCLCVCFAVGHSEQFRLWVLISLSVRAKSTQKRRSIGVIWTIYHGDSCWRSGESQCQLPPGI